MHFRKINDTAAVFHHFFTCLTINVFIESIQLHNFASTQSWRDVMCSESISFFLTCVYYIVLKNISQNKDTEDFCKISLLFNKSSERNS